MRAVRDGGRCKQYPALGKRLVAAHARQAPWPAPHSIGAEEVRATEHKCHGRLLVHEGDRFGFDSTDQRELR